MNCFLTRRFTCRMSWLVISNILVLHFFLNSYIQNIPVPDTRTKEKKQKEILFISLEESLQTSFQMLKMTKPSESNGTDCLPDPNSHLCITHYWNEVDKKIANSYTHDLDVKGPCSY